MTKTTLPTNGVLYNQHETDIARHRFGTICLAAFSWWGALQGFGPAIALKIIGDDLSTTPYVGNQPGAYSPTFFLFLIGWAPFCILAAYLIHRYAQINKQSNKHQTIIIAMA